MSESWFEGVGLAESPFADEVEAPVEAWPAETVRLPPSWPEEEEDGAGGELPLATEAWTPWAPAESLAEAAEAEEAEDGPGTGRLSASRLEWPSASADQLAFMRAVSDRHVAQVLADASANVPDAPAEPPTHRKVDRWDGAFELSSPARWSWARQRHSSTASTRSSPTSRRRRARP
jgi:hypothetical protein